jgi:hypothetical protein
MRACLLALTLCVQGTAFEDVVMSVLTAGGPVANASIIPEYVRLHDDKVSVCGGGTHGEICVCLCVCFCVFVYQHHL